MGEQGGAKTGFKRLTVTGLLQSCRSISFLLMLWCLIVIQNVSICSTTALKRSFPSFCYGERAGTLTSTKVQQGKYNIYIYILYIYIAFSSLDAEVQ